SNARCGHLRPRRRGGGAVPAGSMKGRGWMVLGGLGVLVLVLVLLRGGTTQRQSPNHASTSDAADGTSALRAYADALGYPSGSVEGSFSLPAAAGLLFVFTPSNGFSADQVAQLILCNGYLGKPDNGRFAADLMAMTPASGRVWFDEFHHGAAAGASTETAWMTTPWGFALLLAVVITFAGLAMRGRAFGPAIPLRAREDRSTAEYAVAVGSLLHRTGARRVTLEALLAATRRAVAQRVGLGADVPSDRLTATIAQRAPAAAAELSRAERELELATAGEAEVLEMARRLHDLAYPSLKESA